MLFVNDNKIFSDEDFNSVTLFGGEMGILSADQDDPETIIHVRPTYGLG